MHTMFTPFPVFTSAILLRTTLFFYGLFQDANSPLKYTDIDYYVFTSASSYVSHGQSPYERETYRYTPLLAWLLLPTTWSSTWFSFGKILFAVGDIVAGWLIVLVLRGQGMDMKRALKFSCIWLLNPMVATISTRGSSEGLLGVMVMALLWTVLKRRIVLAGVLLGLAVHFKIYPFIYAPSIIWWLDDEHIGSSTAKKSKDANLLINVKDFFNQERITLAITSLATFISLNLLMYSIYGFPFLQHTYLHHITRIDHRHNFSPYNTLLYLSSSFSSTNSTVLPFKLESLAFIPQLFLSVITLPFLLAKKDLASTMLAQTFAFVTFNKVCTSQYFLWYLIFLPLYLPTSNLLHTPTLGFSVLFLWLTTQALWLHRAYALEFLGSSTFAPSLWLSSLLFFLVNCWILGIIVSEIGFGSRSGTGKEATEKMEKRIA